MDLPIGELFILGFRDPLIPGWLQDFARNFGLGGVILFDYDCTDQKYERNVFGPAQLQELCENLHALPSRPLIFIDQEGGKVRRLKEERGFIPLPSARQFGRSTASERRDALRPSYAQMRQIGIDVNLSPVVDLDINPDSPDVGSVQRSYSSDPKVVAACVEALVEVAASVNLKLCLKHFPGTGGAKVNPHDHVMDLSDCLTDAQVSVFKELISRVPMVLFSHGIVNQWEKDTPVCLSAVAVNKMRAWAPDACILTDDLQMQGVQKLMSTGEACAKAVHAGADFILIGNNMKDEQDQAAEFARQLLSACAQDASMRAHAEASIKRVRKLKFG
ncbi:glycoside hydrolase family 3 N-terminal domain-containing protein [Methylocystis sp. SB2]|uniref:glycoside hydrolase family 3 N-terminal domain-containing protein n=1 Tax=Methylocystis sp. (strain SB2) TaxID=743836 RepID=UPI00041435E1|nr:glycoside hydrolase family 3 N-terminal domain-containing protein [Methylocystis sp. SB2]ULO25269.1 glycoside hydrolase family 3 protein [Methylocystis sp. SB2]